MTTESALTYCLNIHPTETWEEVRTALTGPVAKVREAFAPGRRFPVGLRFSARALAEVAKPGAREELKAILRAGELDAITVNGFPYGRFHGTRVKEDVYRPDWREAERLHYTCELAELMAEIAPKGQIVSLSTVPGCFRPLAEGASQTMAETYLRAAAHLVALERRTGVQVALAIEPEPYCFLETIAETIDFFRDHLFSKAAVARLAELTGLSAPEAEAALPRHLGLCYDVCHAAVEFEDPAESVAALAKAGVPIHKLQLSAALRLPRVGGAARATLAAFNEPTYLHQVVMRTPDGLIRVRDLPEALARGASADGEEWRVHFHVPIFLKDLGPFESTQDFLAEILALHRKSPISPHLEVETYTFDVLPPDLCGSSLEAAVGRELEWVREQLCQ